MMGLWVVSGSAEGGPTSVENRQAAGRGCLKQPWDAFLSPAPLFLSLAPGWPC